MAARASTGTWVATANSFNPAVTGTTIDASSWNAILAELQVEVTDSLNRSGKGGMLADLDMSSNNVINLASASADHHAVRFDQVVQGDAGAGGVRGLVPAPAAGDAAAEKFLKADGTWATTPAGASGANLATAADYWAATAGRVLETSATWAAFAPVQLTDAATVTCNFAAGVNFYVTFAGNRTLKIKNAKAGQSGAVYIKQSGGARTITYSSEWKFAGGSAPALSTSLSTASGAWDVLSYNALSATFVTGSMLKNVK